MTLLLSWSQLSFCYVHNQTKSGINVHWPKNITNINIYLNSENTQNLTNIEAIAADSIKQWNGHSRISLNLNSTTGKDQPNLNELYFSSDPNVFNGSGVVGITLVSFSETTGEISGGDILINDTFAFSTSKSDPSFLGNVITHESGHFLGLGHGQVLGSTMFYALTRGQSVIDEDDKAGIFSIYPIDDSTKGSISGTVIGGKNLSAVFGSHVQAISVKTGKVIGASISEINGKFQIDGLPTADQYLLYTSPVKQMGIPQSYANARSDFCESSTKYRGSFFQSCNSRSEGFPQAVKLDSNKLDVGNITIRCGLDTPPGYIQNKNSTNSGFNINSNTASGLGGSFVGFFSALEIQQTGVADYFKINFNQIQNWDTISSDQHLYVQVKILNQNLFSTYKPNISVKRGAADTDVELFIPKYLQESDGGIRTDSVINIPINRLDSSDNQFNIKITPDFSDQETGIPFTKDEIYPSRFDIGESLYFYLAIVTVVKANEDGSFTQVASKNDLLSDNSLCPDAINTYSLTKYTTKGENLSSDRKKVAGCGTIDDSSNNSNGGPGGFMVGLLFSFIISYLLSRYSKLA